MNILFLTLVEINDFNQTGIYPDLIYEFAEHGHDMYVISPCEEKNMNRYTLLRESDHIHLISAIIHNYYGVGHFKKGIATLVIGKRYFEAINKAIPKIKFELILYSTPPITFYNVIKKLKKRDKAYTYLLLKDIWPQGLIDVGALSSSGLKGIVTCYFKHKEKKLYDISDFIGCMSKKNCEYIIERSCVCKDKVEVCPNSIKVRGDNIVNKKMVRKYYTLPIDKTIFVYGGNLGVAQGIDFIIRCLIEIEKKEGVFILIVGSGTEYKRLSDWFEANQPKNSKLISFLPKKEYLEIMVACDVGLIFLDHRFTIPNFPSRILSYLEYKMPILAVTDTATDIGEIIVAGEFGYWCESNDVKRFGELLELFMDTEECSQMGINGYNYLIKHYSTNIAYKIIMKHIEEKV